MDSVATHGLSMKAIFHIFLCTSYSFFPRFHREAQIAYSLRPQLGLLMLTEKVVSTGNLPFEWHGSWSISSHFRESDGAQPLVGRLQLRSTSEDVYMARICSTMFLGLTDSWINYDMWKEVTIAIPSPCFKTCSKGLETPSEHHKEVPRTCQVSTGNQWAVYVRRVVYVSSGDFSINRGNSVIF